MAIVDSGAVAEVPLLFNNVFVTELNIVQEQLPLDSAQASYRARVSYVWYAVDGNGNRLYNPKVNTVNEADLLQLAIDHNVAGDPNILNVMVAMQPALSSLISEKLGLPSLGVVV